MVADSLARVMQSLAQLMRAEFSATETVVHRGGKGHAREEIVQSFLTKYLPSHVEATARGQIITSTGEVSSESDILIIDRSTPPFLRMRDFRIVPSECTYGVLEVKSHLTGSELIKDCEKIKRVKSLPKTAYRPQRGVRVLRAEVPEYLRTAGLIFAFNSINLTSLGAQFRNWCAGQDATLVPDGVWILGKGGLVWSTPGTEGLHPRPVAGCELRVVRADPVQDILLLFATHLSALFAYAEMPPLNLDKYSDTEFENLNIDCLSVDLK